MQVEEDWCANQVLGEVPEERNRPDTHKTQSTLLILLSSDSRVICVQILRTYSSEVKTSRHDLPLIHILKHTTRSVCGGEDAFVCWNSGSFKEEKRC